MRLIRFEPFREADDFFRALSHFGRWPRDFDEHSEHRLDWAPAADISETDKEYLVKAELPGIKREDVKVTLDDGVLTISGERKLEKEEKDEKNHRIERYYGSFVRRFSLPDNADAANIRAESKDGVLNVRVPKLTSEKPKVVELKVQ